jgi:primary-amine oxidase
MAPPCDPLAPLSSAEVCAASAAARRHAAALGLARVRFNTVTLAEPPKRELLAHASGGAPRPPRRALCVLQAPPSCDVIEALVNLPHGCCDGGDGDDGAAPTSVHEWLVLDGATLDGQPLATPDDCLQAEAIVRADAGVHALLLARGIDPAQLFMDPWTVHAAPAAWRATRPRRLIQVFCYLRLVPDDNEYAHPLDILPLVDLLSERVISVEKYEHAPPVPRGDNGNYHEKLVTLPFRTDLKPLHVTQPQGPSFKARCCVCVSGVQRVVCASAEVCV